MYIKKSNYINFKYIIISVLLIFFLTGCSQKGFLSVGDISKLKNQGIECLKKGDYQCASKEFNKALQFNLRNSSLQFLNALTYHLLAQNGNTTYLQYAEIGYKLAIKFDENNWLAYRQLALLYLQTKKFALARKYAIQTLLYKPKDVESLYILAYSSYYLQNLKLSLSSLETAYKLDKNNSILLKSLIISYASLNQFDKANLFLNKYSKTVKNKKNIKFLKERIADWFNFYKFHKDLLKITNNISKKDSSNDNNLDSKMVNVNIVIIGTHQQLNTQRGINLFDGLTFQFGKTFSNSFSKTITDDITETTSSQSITSTISIPDIKYSLNIFNDNLETYTIIAKPSLVALNDHQSEYFSGDSMHIGLIATGDSASSEIVDLPIGVKLTVTPHFISNNTLRLEVDAERTTLSETSDSGTFQSVVWTSKKHVHSNVVLQFGDTLIIGGLNEREMQDNTSSTPILSDIPILKYFFSSNSKMKWTRSDMILLTPMKVTTEKNKLTKKYIPKYGINELKILYPSWQFDKTYIFNPYLNRELRYEDFNNFIWYKKKSLNKILSNIF